MREIYVIEVKQIFIIVNDMKDLKSICQVA